MKKMKKTFVVDTNVLINDAQSLIDYLRKGDVVLPIVVLEELDGLKKDNPGAREAIRLIERITANADGRLLNGGIPVIWEEKELGGKFSLRTLKSDRILREVGFDPNKADNQIIGIAHEIREEGKDLTLITDDVNVRSKARALGIRAEASSSSANEKILSYRGFTIVEDDRDILRFMEAMRRDKSLLKDLSILPFKDDELVEKYNPRVNQYFVIPGEDKERIFFRFDGEKFVQRRSPSYVMGIKPKNIEQAVALDLLLDSSIPLISLSGPAGTGKTLLALAAMFQLLSKKDVERILISRSEVTVGRSHGFLPGTAEEKLAPYIQPFVDNYKLISELAPEKTLNKLERSNGENGYPFETPSLLYMRGRSLNRVGFIVDEAQNLTTHQVRTLITRAGMGAKFIFLGDLSQVDTPGLSRNMNGLSFLMKRMASLETPLYAHIGFQKVVRSPLAELGTRL